MLRSIIPREELFFDRFEEICALLIEATELLQAMLDAGSPFDAPARRIKAIENEADQKVRQAAEKLHKTFVTPLDRQDILKLTVGLDDILDMTEAVSSRLELYEPKRVIQEANELAGVLVQSVKQVSGMVGLLRNLKKESGRILGLAVEISHLENEADRIHHGAIARLFREEDDMRELIKWKDILDHMEDAVDLCEDVSDIAEGIVLEYI